MVRAESMLIGESEQKRLKASKWMLEGRVQRNAWGWENMLAEWILPVVHPIQGRFCAAHAEKHCKLKAVLR